LFYSAHDSKDAIESGVHDHRYDQPILEVITEEDNGEVLEFVDSYA